VFGFAINPFEWHVSFRLFCCEQVNQSHCRCADRWFAQAATSHHGCLSHNKECGGSQIEAAEDRTAT